MGQGEEVKISEDAPVEIQERGEIYFFYRPKVNREETHGPGDVQRMYIILRPESGEKPVEVKQAADAGKEAALESGDKKSPSKNDCNDERATEGGHGCEEVNIEKKSLFRLLLVGKKSLPKPDQKGRPFWGFVELVTTKLDEIKTALKAEEYDTATRGHRTVPPARAAGEGVYRILRHKPSKSRASHTHLIYKLELTTPEKSEEHSDGEVLPPVQEAMNIEREGSFVIQVRNPEQAEKDAGGGFGGVRKKRKAAFPAHVQGEFGARRFAPADPPDFLNYEGCEFLLVAASDDISGELGVELDEECSDVVRDFGDVAPATPLLKGVWA